MAKTQYAGHSQITNDFMNSIFHTDGGHKHNGAANDGSAGKIVPADEIDATGVTKGKAVMADGADGAAWSVPATIRDRSRGLVIVNNATNPNYQMDIDADEVLMQDTDGVPMRATAVNLTADISAVGANGLDTGAEAGDTWYHIWIIGKADGTVASLLSTSATAPTMPTGYTFKALVGAVRNDGSSNFKKIYQLGSCVATGETEVVTDDNRTAGQQVVLSAVVPPTAKKAHGWGRGTYNTGMSMAYVYAFVNSTELFKKNFAYVTANSERAASGLDCPLYANSIWWKTTDTGSKFWIFITGWEY